MMGEIELGTGCPYDELVLQVPATCCALILWIYEYRRDADITACRETRQLLVQKCC